MRPLRMRRRTVALMAVGAMLVTACGSDEPEATDSSSAPDDSASSDDATPDDTGDMTVATDIGVTEDACPDAVNADNGCIYLGTLSDLTEGPFAALGIEIVAAQEDFWARVNANGGIGGYDINVTEYVRDNKYNPEEHVAQFRQIEPNILAIAQTLGTPPTLAALDLMKDNDVVGVPASWWSGWAFDDIILDSGHSYCVEAMNGLDFAHEEFVEGGVESLMAVHYPGDYGGDAAAGVQVWAEANGIDFDPATDSVETLPNAAAGNQDGPVGAILGASPSVVYIATGPLEAAEIIGKAASQGYQGRFIGAVPTFNPAVMANPDLAALLPAVFRISGPWAPFGADTAAHAAMVEAVGDDLPSNDGYTFGWIWQYPLKAAIEKAVENGDLTRAGLRAAVSEITVDYEGALPDRTYGGGATAPKDGVIAVPDPDAPLGLSLAKDFFVGPTAAAYDQAAPCISLG